jgi:hypothetical protein
MDVGSVAVVSDVRNIQLRRLLLKRSNNRRHSHLLRLVQAENVLVEECEAYDFYHNAFEAVRTDGVTFRRNYFHSRNASSSGSEVDNATRGEIAIQVEESSRALLENNLAEVVDDGFSVVGRAVGSPYEGPPLFPLTGTALHGNLVRDALGYGIRVESRCDSTPGCERLAGLVSDTRIVDSVVLQAGGGFVVDGAPGTRIQNGSALEVRNGAHLTRSAGNLTAPSSAHVERSLTRAFSGVAFWAESADAWSFVGCATQASLPEAVAFSPTDSSVTQVVGPTEADACTAHLGATTALRGAVAGLDVGASVLYRSEAGVLGSVPLWDPTTGAFPCGAVVPGINDDPRESCTGAHERFRVGTAECPLPYVATP